MISVEQVHRLETRIERVLRLLAELRGEKASLTTALQAANAGLEESARKLEESERARQATEEKLRQFRTNQAEIEEPLNRMLHQLDEFEGEQAEAPPDPPAAAEDAAEPEAQAASAAADAPAEAGAEPGAETSSAPAAEADAAAEGAEQPPKQKDEELDIF